MTNENEITLQAALKAQAALRADAGLAEEKFQISEFVGMISDEIEVLRKLGRTDDQIAHIISSNSPVKIGAETIRENYAPPELRGHRE